MSTEHWPTKPQAAQLARMSVRTIERHIKSGKLEARRNATGSVIVNPDDLSDLLPGVMPAVAATSATSAATTATSAATTATSAATTAPAPRQPPQRRDNRPSAATTAPGLSMLALLELLNALAGQLRQPPAERQPEPLFLTLEQAAELTGLSPRYLLEQIKSAQLPAIRDGRSWKLKRADLQNL